jgi:hypothetical protein
MESDVVGCIGDFSPAKAKQLLLVPLMHEEKRKLAVHTETLIPPPQLPISAFNNGGQY